MDVLITPPLPLAEWLSVVEREYLSAFVPAGGAAVKLAILDDAAVGTAAACLVQLGQAQNMLTVRVDAGRTRMHLMQEVFFTIARALPWGSLLQHYLEELFKRARLSVAAAERNDGTGRPGCHIRCGA